MDHESDSGINLNFDGVVSSKDMKRHGYSVVSKNNLSIERGSGMSNYPPGVTGFEYQIAGADEEYLGDFHCEHEVEKLVIVKHQIDELMKIVNSACNNFDNLLEKREIWKLKHYGVYAVQMKLMEILENVKTTIEPCDFDGEVEFSRYKRDISWNCPVCDKNYDAFYDPYDI
jgi:hypothetical protein